MDMKLVDSYTEDSGLSIDTYTNYVIDIYHIKVPDGYTRNFAMTEREISLGAYYNGKLVITAADNPVIVGYVFNGFYNFVEHPEFNTLGSAMTCVAQGDQDWYCVHSTLYTNLALVTDGSGIFTMPNGMGFVIS